MAPPSKPNWQLPEGVSRATWDYIQAEHIATEYDSYFSDSPLMRLDVEILKGRLASLPSEHLFTPDAPLVADLGCGTGRVAAQLLPLGYRMVNVDLSPAMLREVEAKVAAKYPDRSQQVVANLVRLDEALPPATVDYACCLFSSIGMIRGRQNRRRFLAAVGQVLRPGGELLLHVHNRYRSLRDPGGPGWLLRSYLASWRDRQTEFGDRVYAYRGLPKMFLHIYSRHELWQDLRSVGFTNIRLWPISHTGERLLPARHWFPSLRAGGYFSSCSTAD